MAYLFGDGFDLYASMTEATFGYWDSGNGANTTPQAGRFSGSRAMGSVTSSNFMYVVKSSGVNDSIHHLTFALNMNVIPNTIAQGFTIQLADGATNQCGIAIRGTGDLMLFSGTVPAGAGSPLATFPLAITVAGVWTLFEVEIVIHNTAGSISVRRNGSPSNEFTQGSLNTRGGTANNYANKVSIGQTQNPGYTWLLDDFLWRSDASSVPWIGDVRCATRMPLADVTTQFTRSLLTSTANMAVAVGVGWGTGIILYTPFTPVYGGTAGSITLVSVTGFTGTFKCSIFGDSGGGPGAVLGSATPVVNPTSGNVIFTFGTPVAVSKGVQYWWGISHDVTASFGNAGSPAGRQGQGVTHAAFPVANPITAVSNANAGFVTIIPTVNADMTNEPQQDGTASYVYDATVNDADFYTIGPVSSVIASTIAVTTRGFMQKSDAGTRTASVRMKSGATTVVSPTVALSSSFLWAWRTDPTDPDTGAAWAAAAVNTINVGPMVVS